jgi:hypothetical protein
MKDWIEYTILKAVQTVALVTLPIYSYGEFRSPDGSLIWGVIDLMLCYSFYQDLKHRTLEKSLHKELY